MGADAGSRATEVDVVITAYLDALTRRVPAGIRSRAAIRAELRDGLECAAQAHVGRGAEPVDAARRAVDEFGPPEVVAGAFTRELCAAWARWTAVGMLAGGPLVGVAWIAATPAQAGASWAGRVAAAVSMSSVYPFVLAVVVPAVVLAVAGTGRLMYRLPLLRRIAPAAAVLAAVLCLGGDVSLLAQAGMHGPAGGALTLLAAGASALRLAVVGAAGWRLVRLVRVET